MHLKRIAIALVFAATLVAGGLTSAPALAQTPTALTGLQAVGNTIVLPDTDPRIIASRIINVALGLLAIIFLIIIVYAGFLYMTSGGDAAKTETAIKWIRNGIIGLIIILSSWAIAHYVIQRLIEAAGGGGGGGPSGGGGNGGGFTPGGSSSVMRVVSISPAGSIDNRKVIVKVVFSLPLSGASASSADAIIVTGPGNARVPGTIARVGTNKLFFTPSTSCPPPNANRFCFDADADFTVHANDAVIAGSGGQPLRCGGFNPSCDAAFHTSANVDTTDPTVTITSPLNGMGVPANSLVDLTAFASDNVAIGFVSFNVDGSPVGDDGPQGSSPATYSARVRWDTAGLAPGTTSTIVATAYDTDTGTGMSSPVTVRIRAAHCFNGVQDQGETGLDCGGSINTPDYCGACAGGACTVNTDCASGVCANGICVEQPIITSVVPDNGAVGSYVTISGFNFGTNGSIFFLGPQGSTPVKASPPLACVQAGSWSWGARQVIIEAPQGAQNGPIRLTNAGSGLSDDTNALPDPALPDFLVNNTLRPGLCAVRPSSAPPATVMTLQGTGFGTASGLVQFGNQALSAASWADQAIQASYPNVAEGPYDVTVNVQGVLSNPMTVNVLPATGGGTPQIVDITPTRGPIGQYVTITGRNFGTTVGTVFFENIAQGVAAPADTNFPAACQFAFWHDTNITVKVPRLLNEAVPLPVGAYAVYVRTATPNTPESNRVNFDVNTDPLAPGLCAIAPRVGPQGTNVALIGERFGSSGNVIYGGNVVGAASASWTDGEIASRIPAGARTGPVHVEVNAANGVTLASNPVLLDVRNCNEAQGVCTAQEACCSDGACHPPTCTGGTCTPAVCTAGPAPGVFAWQFSTGIIPRAPEVVVQCGQTVLPSPTPWSGRDGGDSACVNAQVGLLFSTRLDPATVNAQTVHVSECTGSGSDPCAQKTEIRTTILPIIPANGGSGDGQDYVEVNPGTLKQSTTYSVVLTTGIKGLGAGGAFMTENRTCGSGNAYCFTFRTRGDAAPCVVSSVLVSPAAFTANEQNEKVAYGAVPRPSDICQIMDCAPYDWRWDVSQARASITNAQANGRGACRQTATALMETAPGQPVQVRATETASSAVGSGDLTISFLKPEVVAFGPACKQACVNALIWATINIPVDPATVSAQNVEVRECEHEDCRTTVGTLPINPANIRLTTVPGSADARARQISIIPRGGTPEVNLLQPGHFYRVVLRGGANGIRSTSQAALTKLNSPEGFTWTFATRSGDGAVCVAERVDVSPAEKYASYVGDRQSFTATPYTKPDECSANGQALVSDAGYAWASSQPNVAALVNNGQTDTGTQLPAGCSANCTLLGADGVSGKTARCGNGIVETTSAGYCTTYRARGGTQTCVTLSSGGSGGEQCDGDAGCNAQCLWDSVQPVSAGGTCGNGRVDFREDCDPGRICTGTLPNSTSTPPGSDCTDPARAAACVADHGNCATADARGCSRGCRALGASVGGSTCGNGDVSDGENCDDGNRTAGDGCSPDCLLEGSKSTVRSLCGNGTIESGEACELVGGVFPAGCDPKTCLRTGTDPCVSGGSGASCCGNGVRDAGEDCDDGNSASGDGCSTRCLNEGSSVLNAKPSFCGDGVVGTGEAPACELAPAGPDGRVDAVQLAAIVGNAAPDSSGRMSSEISAALQGVSGHATYGLQCGFSSESSCASPPLPPPAGSFGLTDGGCCSLRPTLTDFYPANGMTDVCRNVLIRGSFNVEMDEQSLTNNFVVARQAMNACAAGEQELTFSGNPASPGGIRGFFVRLWQKVLAFFHAAPAQAQVRQVWCKGSVTGTLTFTRGSRDVNGVETPFTSFAYTLDHAFEANATYVIRFAGDANLADNNDPKNHAGIKTKSGVVSERTYEWTFTTGQEICRLNSVRISDETTGHPFLFTTANETHPFVAYAQSIHNGQAVPISSISSYAWEWENWTVSNANIATLNPAAAPQPLSRLSADLRSVVSTAVSGAAYVTARAHVVADDASATTTAGLVIAGSEKITSLICENPWPSRAAAPFEDAQGSAALAGTTFENGPYYNFAMTYCRDAGAPGPNEDIPPLITNAVPANATQRQQGILREYLFTFSTPDAAQARDAIGLRIMDNPRHLSIADWYASKGFTGKPAPLTVDGYPALREGRTVYISAVSTDGPGFPLYSNVYVVSYNDGATAVTRQIYDALIQSLSFNANLTQDISGTCEDASRNVVTGAGGLAVSCAADWQCGAYGGNLRCANFKAKIQRDLIRIGDFQIISRALESAKTRDGKYPVLASGSYLAGFSTSLWPSWKDALEKTIAPQGGSLPKDPLNRFVTCGRCAKGGTACSANADCRTDGDTCEAQSGYDPVTCWNEQTRAYLCPIDGTNPTSHLYAYSAVDQGARYQLASEFEVPPPDRTNPAVRWWSPPLFEDVKQCVTQDEAGLVCATDADCRTCPLGNCANVPVVTGACRAVGGRYQYANICAGGSFGESSTCGDGIIDANPAHDKCLMGTRDGQSCQADTDCPGGTCAAAEICETAGPTASRDEACTAAGGAPGMKKQVCLGCRQYVDDASHPGCFATSQCGNGRIDAGEVCDDGKSNGTYGQCNLSCSGYGGFCGDQMTSLGEVCDLGAANGAYCSGSCTVANSCNLSCSGVGPRCGDRNVDAPAEACDGNSVTSEKAICSDGLTPCSTDADCPGAAGGSCGGGGLAACGTGRVCGGSGGYCASGLGMDGRGSCRTDADCGTGGGACTLTAGMTCGPNIRPGLSNEGCGAARCPAESVPLARTRTCSASCQYGAWSDCRGTTFCGNGVKDAGEECDDGNADDSDGCTTFCRKNVCGDRFVYSGVEECDLGPQNGASCNTAEYGSTCTNCSTSCKFQLTQGGFCGNGVVDSGSAEQCDTAGDLSRYVFEGSATPKTCRSLGYDYAVNFNTSAVQGYDVITCSNSCSYAGCAMCGSPPPSAPMAGPNLFNGIIEGELYDTLFQQPVENGRVTLFYRGLQVAVTASDGNGYFKFENLDRHEGCNQYKLIIDSYADNPRTGLFNEATRGGYMAVETPSFAPHENPATESGRATLYTSIILNWGRDTDRATPDTVLRGYTIPRFNMLPKLRDNEYIAQFWWDPIPGDPANGVQRTIDAFRADPGGTLNAMQGEYHDLMVRLPFTYVPGTFGRCSLPTKPLVFDNTRGDICFNRVNGDVNQPITPACISVDVDRNTKTAVDELKFLNTGMSKCTNKIRATSGYTCTSNGTPTGLPCLDVFDCGDPSINNLQNAQCVQTSEASRSGPLSVLNGQEGAYLFCFHPEYQDAAQQNNPDCRNFIVPPQSTFISGKGGQYDLIVSQFWMSNWYGGRTTAWLYDHNARMELFTRDGFYKRWSFRDYFASTPGKNVYPPEWEGDVLCPNGNTDSGIMTSAADAPFSGAYPQTNDPNGRAIQNLAMTFAGGINQYWVPFSIDTSNRQVVEWDASFNDPNRAGMASMKGYHMAANRYFADTYARNIVYSSGPGNGTCYSYTCGDPSDNGAYLPSGSSICSDGGGNYTGDLTRAACDAATQAQCATTWPGIGCATKAPGSEHPCVQLCSPGGSDCSGTVVGSSGAATVNAFCGGLRGGCGVTNTNR
jgi:cysteine-rich repeat protein